MEFNKLQDVEPFSNYVLVKPDEYERVFDGVKFEIDTSFYAEPHAVTSGTVVLLPDELRFHRDKSYSMEWETTNELQACDQIFFYYLSYINAMSLEQCRKVTVDGVDYILVKYEYIYAAKREGEIIPVNGYVLVEPVEKREADVRFKVNLQDHEEHIGKIAYVGSRLTNYRRRKKSDPDVILHQGDYVLMDKSCDIVIQHDGMKTIEGNKTFFRVQRKNIICRLNDGV